MSTSEESQQGAETFLDALGETLRAYTTPGTAIEMVKALRKNVQGHRLASEATAQDYAASAYAQFLVGDLAWRIDPDTETGPSVTVF